MKSRVMIPAVCLAVALICCYHGRAESAAYAQERQPSQAFSASLPPALAGKTITPGGKAHVDVVNKNSKDATVIVKDENVLDINGWAFDDKTRSVPGTVFIELAPVKGGEKYYAAANRGERPDLVNTFSEPAYKKAGYSLEADIKSVLPGQYNINIIQIGDGYAIKASTGKRIDKKGLFFLR